MSDSFNGRRPRAMTAGYLRLHTDGNGSKNDQNQIWSSSMLLILYQRYLK